MAASIDIAEIALLFFSSFSGAILSPVSIAGDIHGSRSQISFWLEMICWVTAMSVPTTGSIYSHEVQGQRHGDAPSTYTERSQLVWRRQNRITSRISPSISRTRGKGGRGDIGHQPSSKGGGGGSAAPTPAQRIGDTCVGKKYSFFISSSALPLLRRAFNKKAEESMEEKNALTTVRPSRFCFSSSKTPLKIPPFVCVRIQLPSAPKAKPKLHVDRYSFPPPSSRAITTTESRNPFPCRS